MKKTTVIIVTPLFQIPDEAIHVLGQTISVAGEMALQLVDVFLHNVDNHACILLSMKNILGIRKKCPQKVTAVLRPLQARIRGQDRLWTGGPKQESFPSCFVFKSCSTDGRTLPQQVNLLIFPQLFCLLKLFCNQVTLHLLQMDLSLQMDVLASSFLKQNNEGYHRK